MSVFFILPSNYTTQQVTISSTFTALIYFFFIFALFKLPNAVYTFTFSVSDGLKKGVGEFPNKRKTKCVANVFCFFSASVYTLAMLAKLRFEPFQKSKGIAS